MPLCFITSCKLQVHTGILICLLASFINTNVGNVIHLLFLDLSSYLITSEDLEILKCALRNLIYFDLFVKRIATINLFILLKTVSSRWCIIDPFCAEESTDMSNAFIYVRVGKQSWYPWLWCLLSPSGVLDLSCSLTQRNPRCVDLAS